MVVPDHPAPRSPLSKPPGPSVHLCFVVIDPSVDRVLPAFYPADGAGSDSVARRRRPQSRDSSLTSTLPRYTTPRCCCCCSCCCRLRGYCCARRSQSVWRRMLLFLKRRRGVNSGARGWSERDTDSLCGPPSYSIIS